VNQSADEILGHEALIRAQPSSPRPINTAALFGDINMPSKTSRRQKKWIRFLICEATALILLGGALVFGLSSSYLQDTFTALFKVLILAAASAVVLIPIIFYGLPGSHPRVRR
jgi:hypothetical protein